MPKTTKTPILIVGGGAAGTVLSLELARRGVPFRTVDRLPGPAPTSRAITVHARTLEFLERLDRRLLDRFLDRGIRNKGYVLHFVDEGGTRSEVRPGMDYTTLDCGYPYILIHRQDETENFVRDYLREEYGRETEWNTRCTDVKEEDGAVTATLRHEESGEEERVRCRYLVAADGINSRVRQAVGLSQKGQNVAGMVLQNLDAYLHGFPDADDWVHYCAGTDHFIMVAKLPGGFYRLLLSDRGEAADPDAPPGETFQRILDKHFDGIRLGETVWHSKWEHWQRLAETYRRGNVFLAGDSAHVHPTTGGQGMNCCMQDAFNLGWKLAMVQKGDARPGLLDTYEAERRPVAEQVIWAASSLQDVFMGHGRDIRERSRKIEDREWLEAVVDTCAGISYTYRDSIEQPAGLAEMPGPAIGDRAPNADLGSGETVFDLTRHPGFTLLAISQNGNDDLNMGVDRFNARYGAALKGFVVPESPDIAARYGADPRNRLYLIRPDGYIGFRCLATEAPQLEKYLADILAM